MPTNEGRENLYLTHLVIDGVPFEAHRLTLSPAEVAHVMRLDEAEVRALVSCGTLNDASCDGRLRLDPEEVVKAVEERVGRGELGAHVFVELAALVAGRL